jgi:hypothetical protein
LIGKAIDHGDLGRSVLAIRDRPQGASLSHHRKPTINLLGAKGQLKLACSQAAERVETTFLTIRWGANEKSGITLPDFSVKMALLADIQRVQNLADS